MKEIEGDSRMNYYEDLSHLANDFFRCLAAIFETLGEIAQLMDKPNAHMLIEL